MGDEATPKPSTGAKARRRLHQERRRNRKVESDLQVRLAKVEGDQGRLVKELLAENIELDDRVRRLLKQRPAKGSVVLTETEGAEWESFKALGRKAKDVKSALEQGEKDKREAQVQARRLAVRDFSSDKGLRPERLEKLMRLDDLELKVAE